MSKILDSVKIKSGGADEITLRLANIGRSAFFPLPHKRQRREFENITNALMNLHNSRTGEAVVFASSVKGEGASFVSYNVARFISVLFDRSVAWIDANFRSPHPRLNSDGIDFRSLLLYPELVRDIPDNDSFQVIPHGTAPIKSAGLLTSENYLQLLRGLQDRFFFTVIDGPPILDAVDSGHLALPTLGLVLVVESRRLDREVIRHGIQTVRSNNVNVLGSVLNRRVYDIPDFIYSRL